HARAWLKDAGVVLHTESRVYATGHGMSGCYEYTPAFPNDVYENAAEQKDPGQKAGDLKKLWEETRLRKPSS
ncbi:MAG: hypothetical protein IKZ87_02120, partial [Actinomycetaceae bacterium]|nr:hypothetical protein [Actinomycetaceae bacterium]